MDFSALHADLAHFTSMPVVISRPERSVFTVTGPDATRYLHVRLTQAIRPLRPGEGTRAFVLTPQGRIQGELTVLCRGGAVDKDRSYLVLGDDPAPAAREELARAILQFKVADALELTDRTGEMTSALIVTPTDELAAKVVAALGASTADPRALELPASIAVSERSGSSGNDLILRSVVRGFTMIEVLGPRTETLSEQVASLGRLTGAAAVSADSMEAFRILARAPRAGSEISEKVIAPELPIENHVAFNKGCYTGQEVVEMATTRGRPNRKLVRLFAEGEHAPAPGDEVVYESGEHAGKSCGAVTSIAPLAEGLAVILALVKATVPGEEVLRSGATLLRPYPLHAPAPLDQLIAAIDAIPLG